MAIPFSGEFQTPASPDEVFAFLADPNKFGPLLPDFNSMTQEDATHFTVRLNVGVGQIRGTAEIKMELREAVPAQRVLYYGLGLAMGNQITFRIGFDLSPAPESSRVVWAGEADLSGKLALMAGAMLEPLAGKGMGKLMDGLQRALATRTSPPPSPVEPSETEQAEPSEAQSAPSPSETARPAEPQSADCPALGEVPTPSDSSAEEPRLSSDE